MRLELTSIFFTANVSRRRVPHLWLEWYTLLLLLGFLCAVVLRVQEIPKSGQHHPKQHEVEYPRCGLDEFVSSLEEDSFNARHILRSDEMVHCSVVRRETPTFSEPKRPLHMDRREYGLGEHKSAAGDRESLVGSYREGTRRVLCRRSEGDPCLLDFWRL
jgi:hypothetical protein